MIGKIENIEQLAAALESDEFYAFHDAEIVSIKIDRKKPVRAEVILQIHRRIAEFEIEGKKFDPDYEKISAAILAARNRENIKN